MIGDIFRLAHGCFVCPTEATETSDYFFENLLIQSKAWDKIWLYGEDSRKAGGITERRSQGFHCFGLQKQHMMCLEKFTDQFKTVAEQQRWIADLFVFANLPYWSRAWILQEFILARNPSILCSVYLASFHDLDNLACFVKLLAAMWQQSPPHPHGPQPSDRTGLRYEHFDRRRLSSDMFNILHTAWNMRFSKIARISTLRRFKLHCTDTKDRIYSLLGLLP